MVKRLAFGVSTGYLINGTRLLRTSLKGDDRDVQDGVSVRSIGAIIGVYKLNMFNQVAIMSSICRS